MLFADKLISKSCQWESLAVDLSKNENLGVVTTLMDFMPDQSPKEVSFISGVFVSAWAVVICDAVIFLTTFPLLILILGPPHLSSIYSTLKSTTQNKMDLPIS